jgi:simple sugar transport system permease protein
MVALRGGDRRYGGLAVGSAVLGGIGAIGIVQVSVSELDKVVVWSALTASMLANATPLILAALGGIAAERAGVINIGLEGMMLSGAFFGILGADVTGSWELGLAIAALSGILLGLLHALFAVHLRANQIVAGVGINFLAIGLTGYLFVDIYGSNGTPTDISSIPNISLPFLPDGSFFGIAFGDLNLMVWVGLALVVVFHLLLFKTRIGLRTRAVSEHPAAAESAGISVFGIRYLAVTLSGVMAAIGGAALSMGVVDSFNQNMTAGRGFIALAAMIFGGWRPFGALGASLLFGMASALALRLPSDTSSATVLFHALPYILTLVAVAGVIGRVTPPAAVGEPYKKPTS